MLEHDRFAKVISKIFREITQCVYKNLKFKCDLKRLLTDCDGSAISIFVFGLWGIRPGVDIKLANYLILLADL